jgi:hypothetical protein
MEHRAMVDLVKVTDSRGQTSAGQPDRTVQWSPNATVSVEPASRQEYGDTICTPGVIHAYKDMQSALIMSPYHLWYWIGSAYGESPVWTDKVQFWSADGTVVVDSGTKVGCSALTVRERLDIPQWAQDDETLQRVAVSTLLRMMIRCEQYDNGIKRRIAVLHRAVAWFAKPGNIYAHPNPLDEAAEMNVPHIRMAWLYLRGAMDASNVPTLMARHYAGAGMDVLATQSGVLGATPGLFAECLADALGQVVERTGTQTGAVSKRKRGAKQGSR